MASPARSIFRFAMAAALAVSVVLQPTAAAAQEGLSLIRDTEIEDILHKDAAPIFEAAGFDPKNIQILLIGSKDMQAFAAPGGSEDVGGPRLALPCRPEAERPVRQP